MSSILKALKKLEEDKTVRRHDQLKIDSDILKTDNTSHFSTAGFVLAALLLLVGGSGATYIYMKKEPTVLPPGINSPQAPSQALPSVVIPASVIKTEQLPPAAVITPSITSKSTEFYTKTESVTHQPPLQKRKTGTAKNPAKSEVNISSSGQKKSLPLTLLTPQKANQKTVPALRVNGIAFDENSAESVAIINGVPNTTGAVIDGAKIEEILKNRVKFSYMGEKFEIPLGQTNR